MLGPWTATGSVAYLLLYLLCYLYIGLGEWLSDSSSLTSDLRGLLGNVVWIPVPLAALYYFSAEAKSALSAFKPALSGDEERFPRLVYRLTTIPNRVVLLINALLLILFSLFVYANPGVFVPGPISLPTLVMLAVYTSIGFSFLIVLIYQTIRQLRMVARMYSLVEHVNVFHLEPLYSLSGLTAKTAATWILLANLTLVINVLLDVGLEEADLSFWVSVLAVQISFACLAFILPHLGVHRRIQQDKQRALEQNSERLEMAYRELERSMAEGDLAVMDDRLSAQPIGVAQALLRLLVSARVV